MVHHLIYGTSHRAPEYDLDQYHRRMVDAIKTIHMEGIALSEVKEVDADEITLLVLSLLDLCFHLDHVHPQTIEPEKPKHLLYLALQGLATANICEQK